ncbi:MAG TPA: hypothetical protein VIT22_09895 [Pseudoxanthomonas sp.]
MHALLLVAGTSPALAVDRYEGLAYGLGGDTLAYREIHWRYEDSGIPSRLVLYRCPNGPAFARKRVQDRPNATAPDFEFIDGRDGYREGLRKSEGSREVFWQERSDAAVRRKALAVTPQTIVDAGFDAMVRAHWDQLAAGTPLSARFLLPSSLATLPVKLHAVPDGARPGEIEFELRLDAWYGFAAPDTRVSYRVRDRWLSRFEGVGTIRDTRGRHRPVRIEFPDRLRAVSVSRQEILNALREPLDGQCRI